MTQKASDLSFQAQIPAILDALKGSQRIIVEASPGSGKTTLFPKELIASLEGRVLVLEPRRLAARMAALYVASLLNEEVGDRVGYMVRFDQTVGANTQLIYLTEGMFLRLLLRNPELEGVRAVIIDEFHERHLDTDMSLMLLKTLQESKRPDLRLIVMSATMSTDLLENYLQGAKCFRYQAKLHPVHVSYQPPGEKEDLKFSLKRALDSYLEPPEAQRWQGSVLVFLSGYNEQIDAKLHLERAYAQKPVDFFILSAQSTKQVESAIFGSSSRLKVILATNVAESSITIPNVRCVIDSGYAKISGFASWSGLKTLSRQEISQASAIQRAHRAGRTGPGQAIRLYSEASFLARKPYAIPEMNRSELSQTFLQTKALGLRCPLDWYEAPKKETWDQAGEFLMALGALDKNGSLSELGLRMAELPLGIRLGVMLAREPQAAMAWVVAVLQEQDRILALPQARSAEGHEGSDLLSLSESFRRSEGQSGPVRDLYQQLCRSLKIRALWPPPELERTRLDRALLGAFYDRVGESSFTGNKQPIIKLCLGRQAVLAPQSLCHHEPWVLVLNAQEGLSKGLGARDIKITLAHGLPRDLLKEAGLYHEYKEERWEGDKLYEWTHQCYGEINILSSRVQKSAAGTPEARLDLLKKDFPRSFSDADEWTQYHARIDLLKEHGFGDEWPDFRTELGDLFLLELVERTQSLGEIYQRTLRSYIEEHLSYESLARLNTLCPREIKLHQNFKTPIHYEESKGPWIAARHRELLGYKGHPQILAGQLALIVHVLAPNMRPIQVTADLPGFWCGVYLELRGALSRRYPRHPWPLDPWNFDRAKK